MKIFELKEKHFLDVKEVVNHIYVPEEYQKYTGEEYIEQSNIKQDYYNGLFSKVSSLKNYDLENVAKK